ncbi:TlpA family protein disulfide reductase [Chitinophaga sedimenti]|uniref:TlpA family protein disulfide reductase n=1 Tax=Chitinophaga sedimenti TaxID=2033606 RepID=UPI00200345FE|nr:TlpA disulfide reductase family protein [Chitinophaga sedimenti]MCK7556364.1 TlpA family protein disulfide reductase [Chitinophaga sedimenti]
MACTNQMCLPPSKKEFTVAINHRGDVSMSTNGAAPVDSANSSKKAVVYEAFSMAGIDGKTIAAGDVVAKARYTFIDFWASWCAPCRKQARELLPVYDKYKSKGFAVIGVSLDTDAAAWKKAILADGYTWTNVCDLKGFESP